MTLMYGCDLCLSSEDTYNSRETADANTRTQRTYERVCMCTGASCTGDKSARTIGVLVLFPFHVSMYSYVRIKAFRLTLLAIVAL
jgi:hypothetical protein